MKLCDELVARNEYRCYFDDDDALGNERDSNSRVTFSDEVKESFVQVLDISKGDRVITVIEFVSPSNKLYRAARDS